MNPNVFPHFEEKSAWPVFWERTQRVRATQRGYADSFVFLKLFVFPNKPNCFLQFYRELRITFVLDTNTASSCNPMGCCWSLCVFQIFIFPKKSNCFSYILRRIDITRVLATNKPKGLCRFLCVFKYFRFPFTLKRIWHNPCFMGRAERVRVTQRGYADSFVFF